MTKMVDTNPTAQVIERIDGSTWTLRDMRTLRAVMLNPGACGQDIANAIGATNRSWVQQNLLKLLHAGMIEDRRHRIAKAIPSSYYITRSGEALWKYVAGESL